MRLLVDCHCFDGKGSQGINTYIQGLYSSLIPIAEDITFYFAAHGIDNIKKIFGEAENIKYLRLPSGNKYKRLIFDYPNIIKKNQIDIAHFQYISPLIRPCKIIITLHDILFKDYPQYFPMSYKLSKNILFKKSAKKADLLLTVSEYSKERISYHFGIHPTNIFLTPNAVSSDFFNVDKNIAKNRIKQKYGFDNYLLYVSRVEPRKNQAQLLEAYLQLKLWEQKIHLVFIGLKTLPDSKYNNLWKNLGEEERNYIHEYDNIPHSELLYWYNACSLFIYPAIAEGFGIPPLEAGVSRVPVICNNKTAMSDFSFFEDYLIDTSDMEQLKNKIIETINEPKSQSFLDLIKQSIINKYDWTNIAEKYNHLLKEHFQC